MVGWKKEREIKKGRIDKKKDEESGRNLGGWKK